MKVRYSETLPSKEAGWPILMPQPRREGNLVLVVSRSHLSSAISACASMRILRILVRAGAEGSWENVEGNGDKEHSEPWSSKARPLEAWFPGTWSLGPSLQKHSFQER